MPTYELAVLFKTLPRVDLAAALKRTANHIFQEGGIIRKINNLGHNPTPYRITSHKQAHKEAHYFVVEFDCPTFSVQKLNAAYKLDSDLMRASIHLPVQPIVPSECTLDIENKPPPFRPEVQKILEIAERKRRRRKTLKANCGLDFEPFPS